MKQPILGVIGGLGPAATAHFLELIVSMTDARTDQEHVEMLVHHIPSTPDRTAYLLGNSREDPLPFLLRAGRSLVGQGATHIAIPCVTAHYFYDDLQRNLRSDLINGIAETVQLLHKNRIQKVGIMATEGTISSRILSNALEEAGILPIIPSKTQQEEVTRLIYENVKAGKNVEMDRFRRTQQELLDCGAQVILLGCTELSVIKGHTEIGPGFMDILEVLASKCVLACGKKLRKEYWHLVPDGKENTYADKPIGIFGANGRYIPR